MKGAMKIGILALICVFTISAVAGIASAAVTPTVTPTPTPNARAAQVITTDTTGSTKLVTQFTPGDTVYVEYIIQSGKTANIAIYDEDDNLITGTAHDGLVGSGEFTFLALHPGTYYVTVNGYKSRIIGVASFFVLPESVLGAFGALGAGVAAFGIVKYKSAKTPKI